MIRYRDSKIVSTKGERFTQVTKEESEEMKKSYVSWLPAELRDRAVATISEQIRISNFRAKLLPDPPTETLPCFFEMTRLLNFPAKISLHNRPLILPSAPLWLKKFKFEGRRLLFFFAFTLNSVFLICFLILNYGLLHLLSDLIIIVAVPEKLIARKKPRWYYSGIVSKHFSSNLLSNWSAILKFWFHPPTSNHQNLGKNYHCC